MPVGEGCLVLFDLQNYALPEAEVGYSYSAQGLEVKVDELSFVVPETLFDHMRESAAGSEDGDVASLQLYRREGVEAVFLGTVTLDAEVFIKAKGVLEYLRMQ